MSPTTYLARFVVIGSYAPSLVDFRGPLLSALSKKGYSVLAAAPTCSNIQEIKNALKTLSVSFKCIPLSRAGLNLFADIFSLCFLLCFFSKSRPYFVLAYTVKPVVYSGLALRLLRFASFGRINIRSAALITGLGYVYTSGSEKTNLKRTLLRSVLQFLYKESLKASDTIIFQNPDDQLEFYKLGLISPLNKSVRVWGSGVDLDQS